MSFLTHGTHTRTRLLSAGAHTCSHFPLCVSLCGGCGNPLASGMDGGVRDGEVERPKGHYKAWRVSAHLRLHVDTCTAHGWVACATHPGCWSPFLTLLPRRGSQDEQNSKESKVLKTRVERVSSTSFVGFVSADIKENDGIPPQIPPQTEPEL